MLTSTKLIISLYSISFILPICIISLLLVRYKVIKNIEKRYHTILDTPLFISASFSIGARSFNVSDYITYLFLVKIGFLKFKERKLIKPILYEINYTLNDESKFNIIICILFSITHRIIFIIFIFIAYITGVIQEGYLLFTKSSKDTILLIFNISITFLLIHLFLTPIIKFKVLKKIELEYNVRIDKSLNIFYNKYFDVSNYIKDLFLAEKKIFKLKNNYVMKPNLSDFPYCIKNESNLNIYICIIHAYSIKLFALFIFIFAIGFTLDIASVFVDK
ncbi:hypothetical protein GCL60_06830 [Silvanigrella paludirubra]|uniref:Uncharacterized protein n=1 Tax=Silvanigrella paludirubra TaxID=2499159 RepID=A0A6N6VV78_9BACT|nr:hypothetical protein [Silvanigrella paludirubra]KAB8039971.1 hypothetical protein GCL60_06830 [Silvanigrella paludirubra]